MNSDQILYTNQIELNIRNLENYLSHFDNLLLKNGLRFDNKSLKYQNKAKIQSNQNIFNKIIAIQLLNFEKQNKMSVPYVNDEIIEQPR